MKANFIFAGLLVTSFVLTACNDGDFLTENPKTIYTPENAYNTADQVNACVTNMHEHIQYWYQDKNFLMGRGSDFYDSPYWRCTGNGTSNFSTWAPTTAPSNEYYDAFFQLANYANQTLEGYNKEGLAWDEATKKQVFGELSFFRGYSYLSLGEMWGGVPLVDKFYQDLKLDFKRSTREETYQFAIKDLENAVNNLPLHPAAGHITKGAALHFLAEAYVALATIKNNDKADLQKAIGYCDQVMGDYPLMTQRFGTRAVAGKGDEKNGVQAYYPNGNVFFDLFQEGNYDYEEGNTEGLWVFQNDYKVYHQFGGRRLSSPRNMSPVLRDLQWKDQNKNDKEGKPFGDNVDESVYPGGNVSAYVGGRGVQDQSPTSYIITDIWKNDPGDIRNAPCNIRRTFKCINKNSSSYGQEVSVDELKTDDPSFSKYAPVWTKFAPIDDWGYDDLVDGGNRSYAYYDLYALRSAETVLLRAEAKLRLGDKNGAAADINIIRNRAHCQVLATANDMTFQYILDERARELYGEERRWNTLLRMGADGIKSVNEHAMYTVQQPFWKGAFNTVHEKITKWTLFPIPQAVIDANTDAKIEQNPGW